MAVLEEIPRENLEEMILDKDEATITAEDGGKHLEGLTGVEIPGMMVLDHLLMIQGKVVVRWTHRLPGPVRLSIF